ncbi:hypothetical protein ACOMHN_067475 [Nucella lapillus]
MVTSRCSTFMLTTAALFSGAVTLVTLALAVGTDYWLFMKEPYKVPPDDLARFNLTGPIETKIMVYLRSGLWSVCTINLKEGNRWARMEIQFQLKMLGTISKVSSPINNSIVVGPPQKNSLNTNISV